MARCCGGAGCACVIQAGLHATVTGVGSSQDPYVVATDVDFQVVDNSVFNLSLGGNGTSADPWVLQVGFASTAKLGDIPNVQITSATNGQVLAWNSSLQKWVNVAPTTAAAGSVSTDTSLVGDGSVGTPLGVKEDPAGFLQTLPAGLGLTDAAKTQMNRRFGTDLARSADTITPVLNEVTMVDTRPGQQDYWTGTQWLPVTNGMARDFGAEMLALSGSYVTGGPVTLVTRNITFTTDATGFFDVLATSDLVGKAGVLSCVVQETGAIPYKAMVYPNIDHISGTAYRLDSGAVYASQVLTATVTAYIY